MHPTDPHESDADKHRRESLAGELADRGLRLFLIGFLPLEIASLVSLLVVAADATDEHPHVSWTALNVGLALLAIAGTIATRASWMMWQAARLSRAEPPRHYDPARQGRRRPRLRRAFAAFMAVYASAVFALAAWAQSSLEPPAYLCWAVATIRLWRIQILIMVISAAAVVFTIAELVYGRRRSVPPAAGDE